jgi:uncharacterized protein YkwD
MQFETFTKGIYSMIVSVGVAVSSTLLPPSPPPSSVTLQQPSVESFDMVSEDYNIDPPAIASPEAVFIPSEELVTVTSSEITFEIEKEATAAPIVTVEKPKKIVVSPQPSASSKQVTTDSKKNDISLQPSIVSKKQDEEKKESVTPLTIVAKLSDGAEKLFAMVNDHRSKIGLPAFEKDSKVCEMVASRAPQVYDEVFKEGPMHKGFKALNLSYWATENIAAYDTIEKNFDFWLRDDIHRKAIESAAKYSCVACSGTYCSQIFTSFTPK